MGSFDFSPISLPYDSEITKGTVRLKAEYLVVYGLVKRNLFSQLSSSHLLTLCGKQKCMVSKKTITFG